LKLKIIVFQINILQRLVFETLINLLEKSIVDVIDIEIRSAAGINGKAGTFFQQAGGETGPLDAGIHDEIRLPRRGGGIIVVGVGISE
jgi:hypothetical protein